VESNRRLEDRDLHAKESINGESHVRAECDRVYPVLSRPVVWALELSPEFEVVTAPTKPRQMNLIVILPAKKVRAPEPAEK
jgi:hypothetical protein